MRRGIAAITFVPLLLLLVAAVGCGGEPPGPAATTTPPDSTAASTTTTSRSVTTTAAAAPRPAPDFSGTTLDGTPVSLASFKGKPLLLVFWASW